MAEQMTSIDAAVRMSHRHLLAALLIVMVLGLAAVLSLTNTGGDVSTNLLRALPIIVALTVAPLNRMYKRVETRARKAVHTDELRQASVARAWRNGFFAVLGLQPVIAAALSWSGSAHGVALMAALTVTIGTGVALTTLQWYDR
jgi:hypothetical protein